MLICILGRQPGLGLAELEATLGSDSVQPVGGNYALVNCEPKDVPLQELGGTIKIAQIVSTIPSSNWGKVFRASLEQIPSYMMETSGETDHKLELGISTYGLYSSPKQISSLSFAIKKGLVAKGRSVHVVVGEEKALNSASIIHNDLTGKFGFEFLLIANAKQAYIARTLSVQDIESYSKRDFSRPKRDTKVGMLPPKLAQIMLNLAKVAPGLTVLDPFCGTGVVLMEAALKHARLEGSDINPEMVDCTKANLEWLSKEYSIDIDLQGLSNADATTQRWQSHFDRVVSETYLGPTISQLPGGEELKDIVDECNFIVTKFLSNLRPQLNSKSRCCIAVPAWNSPQGLIRLPVVGRLGGLGYERVKFLHADFEDMIYLRPDQIVGRELLVLTVK